MPILPRPPAASLSAPPPSGSGHGFRLPRVWRHRNFRRFLLARFAVSLGSTMLTVAVGWELYARTRSALALGLVGLAQIGPLLAATLPAGQLADRADRRRVLVAAQATVAASSLLLAAVSAARLPVGWTYLLLGVTGAARAFVWPAAGALLPQVVPRSQLAPAVTWSSGCFQLSAALGPALGGQVIAWTHAAAPAFVLTGLLTAAGAAAIASLDTRPGALAREEAALGEAPEPPAGDPPTPAAPPRPDHTAAGWWDGLGFVLSQRVLLGALTLDLFAVLLGGASALLPVYAADVLRVGPAGLGGLQAALPVGSVVMAGSLALRRPLARAGRAMLWAVAAFGAATVVFGLSRNYLLSWVMLAACGAADNVSVVVRQTLVPLLTPDRLRGRVAAVNGIFIAASNELGGLESGLVAAACGPVFAVVSGGVGTLLVVAATAWRWPELRRFGRLDGAGPP